MNPLAVFYHVCLAYDGDPPVPMDHASAVMLEQMNLLRDSGLEDSASEIRVYSNGGCGNGLVAAQLAPKKAQVINNGWDAIGLNRTVNKLREWLPAHPDWFVCFFHNKGATHPDDHFNQVWRRCMDGAVIANWRACVRDLASGYDSAGAHWLTRARYGPQVNTSFWGGMFFWATAQFLLTLPAIKDRPECREDWFLPEGWIGTGPREPKVMDYRPHWPGMGPCST